MDCRVPIDDHCVAKQADCLQIPETIPPTDNNNDRFFIFLEVEITSSAPPAAADDGLEQVVVENNTFNFWTPCPRVDRGNLTDERISDMLSEAGVPLHRQDFMASVISAQADEMANAPHNKGKRVLPMRVSISMVACLCCGEDVVD